MYLLKCSRSKTNSECLLHSRITLNIYHLMLTLSSNFTKIKDTFHFPVTKLDNYCMKSYCLFKSSYKTFQRCLLPSFFCANVGHSEKRHNTMKDEQGQTKRDFKQKRPKFFFTSRTLLVFKMRPNTSVANALYIDQSKSSLVRITSRESESIEPK